MLLFLLFQTTLCFSFLFIYPLSILTSLSLSLSLSFWICLFLASNRGPWATAHWTTPNLQFTVLSRRCLRLFRDYWWLESRNYDLRRNITLQRYPDIFGLDRIGLLVRGALRWSQQLPSFVWKPESRGHRGPWTRYCAGFIAILSYTAVVGDILIHSTATSTILHSTISLFILDRHSRTPFSFSQCFNIAIQLLHLSWFFYSFLRDRDKL